MRQLVLAALLAALVAGCSDKAADSGPASPGTATGSATSARPDATATARATPTAQAAGIDAVQYADPANWLCRPGKTGTPCTVDLNATAKAADGTLTPDPFKPASDPVIDCFYIYPTVSNDPGVNSDLIPGEEERRAATNQFARLGSVCRLFAPMYRQLTLTALNGGRFNDPKGREIAYFDVVTAWTYYLAKENQGRGVVLVGHSQGSLHLITLIKEQIDPNPAVRAKLIAAYILGGGVKVPDGKDVGGDFQNVPACRKPDQTACVVTYASFSAASPPPANSLFARGGVLCVNPAALSGGSADLHPYFTSAGSFNAQGVNTPFVTWPGQLRGECVNDGTNSYLKITPLAGLPFPSFVTSPPWGLHVFDANLTMGDVVALVGQQAKAYLQR